MVVLRSGRKINETKSTSKTKLGVKKFVKPARKQPIAIRKKYQKQRDLASEKSVRKFNETKSKSKTKLGVKKFVKPTGKQSIALRKKLQKQRDLTLKKAVGSHTHLLPPRVCEALGSSSYSYPARAYPPYCVLAFPPDSTEVCKPLLPGVGHLHPPVNGSEAPSSKPDGATVAQGPLPHGVVDHALPSESSTAQGVSSDDVRVAAPPLKFPGVIMRELHRNNGERDILQFVRGLPIVDMRLIYRNKSFTGDAIVVFPNTNCADSALKKDGEKMGCKAVRVFPCSKMDYYNAVASALDEEFEFSYLNPSPTNNNLMEQPFISNNNVMADLPLGQSRSLCESIMDHRQPEPKAKSILVNDENGHNGVVASVNDGLDKTKPKQINRNRQAKTLSGKDHHILRVCGPDYFADTNVITALFGDCDLSKGRVHIVFHPHGKPTGEVLMELASEEDVNKVMSKDNTILGSHLLKILPATMDDLRAKIADQKQEIGGNDKESNNELKLPDGRLQGKQEKSDDGQKVITGVLKLNNTPPSADKFDTGVLKMMNVPPSADKYDIIELFGENNLLLENLHYACWPNGMATGVVYVEFNSVEDAKKALSKNTSKIHAQCVELIMTSKEQAMRDLNEKW